MDVRISYGIDLEKVPDKIARYVKSLIVNDANQLIEIARQLIDCRTPMQRWHWILIDQARQKLASVDRVLNDSQSILTGYINAKKSPPVPTGGGNDAD